MLFGQSKRFLLDALQNGFAGGRAVVGKNNFLMVGIFRVSLCCSYFEGFGRENPSKVRLQKQKEAAEQEGEEKNEEKGKEERRAQSANERDKEEKDKWRSWKAKLGLVS